MKTVSPRLALICATAIVVGASAAASASITLPPLLPLQNGDVTTEFKGDITSVEISNLWGSTTVVAGDKHKMVEAQHANLTTPAASYTLKDGKLVINVECMGEEPVGAGLSLDGVVDLVNSCTEDMTVTIPSNATLTIKASVGKVTTTGINAPQTITSKQGDISVNDANTSKVSAVTGHGDVALDNVLAPELIATSSYGYVALSNCSASTIDAFAKQGGVSIDSCAFNTAKAVADRGTVQITDTVRPGLIDAHSTKGEVNIVVPRGEYALTTKASEAVFLAAIDQDQYSQNVIKAVADDGGVQIVGQQP